MKTASIGERRGDGVAALGGSSVSGHAQTAGRTRLPALVDFVAPAYLRLANDARMTGTTVTHIKVAKDGSVIEAKIVSARAVFATYVLDALKHWKLVPSEEEQRRCRDWVRLLPPSTRAQLHLR